MAGSSSVPLSNKAKESFVAYFEAIQNMQRQHRDELRCRLEHIDKVYQREYDYTKDQLKSKAANLRGDSDRYQNVQVPVVAPQVEAAVTYQASVFLTGYPIFGVTSSAAYIDEALAMETTIAENSIEGGWTRELMMSFRDGFKYNFAPIEVDWSKIVTASVETDIDKNATEGIPTELIWAGNRVRRLDPYNVFVDPRVPPTEVYKRGEFAGYSEILTHIELKTLIAELGTDVVIGSVVPAFQSGGSYRGDNTYVPEVNRGVTDPTPEVAGDNWSHFFGLAAKLNGIAYKDTYEVSTLYCRILPSQFNLKLPKSNTPQVFKLIIVNDQHIIYCERQTNAHAYIPILIGQPLEDGLKYQTKSLASNAEPFQFVASAYMNSILHSRRRAITDRVLYDPSRITSAQINNPNPSAKIPVRPAAYGKNIADSVYAFPYREDQAGFAMAQIQQLLGLANQLSGQNPASQGQFVKGNKTLSEFQSVMDNANGRDQMVSILLEAQLFAPMKKIIKLNILQYQGGTTLYNREKEVEVEVDPLALRKAVLEFKISDGLIPKSKQLNSENFSVALQVMGSSPEIAAGYNVPQLFSYFMKTQGAKISEFEKSEEQMAYEQAMNQWQQMSMLGIEKGIDPEKLPPQPLPEQFGYMPKKAEPKEVANTTAPASGLATG